MNHESVANRVEIVAMTTGILAGLSAAGAAFAEPEGLFAVGVWLGVADEPLVVTAAPMLSNLATVMGVISGFAFFWAKWRKWRDKNCE